MDADNTNGVVALQERLHDPETVASLHRLLDRFDALEQAVTTLTETVQQAPGMVAMVTDIVDETYREAQAAGTDLEQQVTGGMALLRQLTEPHTVAVLSQLLERLDTLEPLLELAERAGQALAASQQAPPKPVGPLGALGALRDPEVRKALGFAVTFAKQFGRALNT